MIFRLFGVGLLLAGAVAMARALVTHEGVGFGEYVTGIAIVIVLLVFAFRVSRSTLQRS